MRYVAPLLLLGCQADPTPISSERLCQELAAAGDCGRELCIDVLCTGGVVGDGDLSMTNDECPATGPTTRASHAAIDAVEAWCWDEHRPVVRVCRMGRRLSRRIAGRVRRVWGVADAG